MSLLSLLLMMLLFVCETWAFARTDIVSNVVIDANVEQTIALNFNVTLYDLHCDFVSVGESLVLVSFLLRWMCVSVYFLSSCSFLCSLCIVLGCLAT